MSTSKEDLVFHIIENHDEEELLKIYPKFKEEYLNTKIGVKDIKRKYGLNDRRYSVLREKVFEETGFRRGCRFNGDVGGGNFFKYKDFPMYVNGYQTNSGFHYRVQKRVDGRNLYFGVYDSLEEAVRVRDFLIGVGWSKCKFEEFISE